MSRIILLAANMTLFSLSLSAAEQKVQAAADSSSCIINIKEVLKLPISHLSDGAKAAIKTHLEARFEQISNEAFSLLTKCFTIENSLGKDYNANELAVVSQRLDELKEEKRSLQDQYAPILQKKSRSLRKHTARSAQFIQAEQRREEQALQKLYPSRPLIIKKLPRYKPY